MHASLVAAFLLGLASGCSDDGGSEDNTASNASTSGGTTNTATTNPATASNTTASNTTASNTVASTATSTTGGASNVPPDGSAESITAFLEAEGYKDDGWVSVHDAPVPETPGSPHGDVRVYLSPAVVAFKQANPDMPLLEPAVPGAMAVKEMYDGSTVVGKAVIFYPETDVMYYCYGPADRCATGHDATTIDAPEWGDGRASVVSQCDTCHAGLVFTELP